MESDPTSSLAGSMPAVPRGSHQHPSDRRRASKAHLTTRRCATTLVGRSIIVRCAHAQVAWCDSAAIASTNKHSLLIALLILDFTDNHALGYRLDNGFPA